MIVGHLLDITACEVNSYPMLWKSLIGNHIYKQYYTMLILILTNGCLDEIQCADVDGGDSGKFGFHQVGNILV